MSLPLFFVSIDDFEQADHLPQNLLLRSEEQVASITYYGRQYIFSL